MPPRPDDTKSMPRVSVRVASKRLRAAFITVIVVLAVHDALGPMYM